MRGLSRSSKLAVLVGLVGSQACHQCGRSKKKEPCHPCDPVVLLRDLDDTDLAALPQDALDACADRSLTETIESRWSEPTCPDKTAHYLVNALDWDDATADDWEQQAGLSFACPSDDGIPIGCAAGPDEELSIVGPAEMEPTVQSAVGMLVRTELLDAPNYPAGQQDLPTLITQTLDDDACEVPQPVFSPLPCTAFLVSSEHVLTAAHCVPALPTSCGGDATSSALSEYSLVFDYLDPVDESDPEAFEMVATGLEIVACGPDGVAKEDDWVLLKFEPPPGFGDRAAFELPEEAVDACEDIYLAGHPMGHPQFRTGTLDPSKPSAWVDDVEPGLFRATLDVVAGYSGAPVFATGDDRLVGMLVAGQFQQSSGCDWVFECGAAGCVESDDHGSAIDLSAIRAEVSAAIAAG